MSNSHERRGVMLVVSSPSGAGKTTLCRRILEEMDDAVLSISATTRDIRPDEADGVHYHFKDKAGFQSMIAGDEFLEWALVHEHYYGTPRGQVEAHLRAGIDVVFDVDWQGARAMKQAMPGDVASVFVLPPSIPELQARLEGRPGATDIGVAKRLAGAARDIRRWGEYDYAIVNDDIDEAYEELRAILISERSRRRLPSLGARVDKLLDDAEAVAAKVGA
ncbi:MAG: guanylate kinase [Pseudomonadota bacterium]